MMSWLVPFGINQPQLKQTMRLYHNRRSIRLKDYDYSSEGLYFITLCCANRKNIFGHIANGQMNLNPLGKIAAEEWEKTSQIRMNISLAEYIIMPNHMHGIISIDYKIEKKQDSNLPQNKFHSPSQTIGAIIRGYKGATTKRINNLIKEIRNNSTGELQFALTKKPKGESQFAPTEITDLKNINLSGEGSIWQRNYYEHIIRTEQAYNNISNYIINNPQKWDNDKLR